MAAHNKDWEFCERSDRLIRLVLGDMPDRTARRLGPILILVLTAATLVSVAEWLWR